VLSAADVARSIAAAIDEHRAALAASVAVARGAGLVVAVLVDLRSEPAWVRLVAADDAMELLGGAPLPAAEGGRTAVVVATARAARAFTVALGGDRC
jgi:hypothetical protein